MDWPVIFGIGAGVLLGLFAAILLFTAGFTYGVRHTFGRAKFETTEALTELGYQEPFIKVIVERLEAHFDEYLKGL